MAIKFISGGLGKVIAKEHIVINDVVILAVKEDYYIAYDFLGITTIPKKLLINGEEIVLTIIPPKANLIIHKTLNNIYFFNAEHKEIDRASKCIDYYVEPNSNSLYRKNEFGQWFTINGDLISIPVFIHNDILISLLQKTSKKAPHFKKESLTTSKGFELIQVGKIVFDQNLEVLRVLGKKISEIGSHRIRFRDGREVQEVKTGLEEYYFLFTDSLQLFTVETEAVVEILKSITYKGTLLLNLRTEKDFYSLIDNPENVIYYNHSLVHIDTDSIRIFNDKTIIKAGVKSHFFYFDLYTMLPLEIYYKSPTVLNISKEFIQFSNKKIYNLILENGPIAYDMLALKPFKINNDTIPIEKVEWVSQGDDRLLSIIVDDKRKIYNRLKDEIVSFPGFGEIQNLISSINKKMWEAENQYGELAVIDSRKGLNHLCLAKVNGLNVVNLLSPVFNIGQVTLIQATVNKVGINVSKVLNLSHEEIELFTLPKKLEEFLDDGDTSLLSSNEIQSINYLKPIVVEEKRYFEATIITYLNTIQKVILEENTAAPIQLEGEGHGLELVSSFKEDSLKNIYRIGNHRLLNVHTLKSNCKKSELVYSHTSNSSCLVFSNIVLPILKEIKSIKKSNNWDYYMIELKGEKSYIVVEQNQPNRLLIKNNEAACLIVSDQEEMLKLPRKLSLLRRLLNKDPGILYDVR